MRIAVAGAGAFGTGLAIALAANGPVTLWARDADSVSKMIETRENAMRLKGCTLPDAVSVSSDLSRR